MKIRKKILKNIDKFSSFLQTSITYSVLVQSFLIIFFLIIFNSYLNMFKNINFSILQFGKDPISTLEKKFEKIKKDLPKSGIIGYAWEYKPINNASNQPSPRDYYLTQYFLSPLIIVDSENLPMLIGKFKKNPDQKKNSRFYIKNLGDNIYLFVKK